MKKTDRPPAMKPGDQPAPLPPVCFIEITDTNGKLWSVNPARMTFAHVPHTPKAKWHYEVYTPDAPMIRTERHPLAVANPRLVPSI